MLRIGKTRDGSKVGVFLYCQEHGNEIATSGVCLETAERLVRNYGTDPETTALVDGLDIFIVPQINGDGATHSLYDSNRRTNLSNHCEDTAKFPSKETDPASRNSWGVDLNRNFSRSVRSSTASSARRPRTARTATSPASSSTPSPRPATSRGCRPRSATSSSSTTSTRPAASSCGRPAPTRAGRVPLPYPPYGTLNFFDQTGKEVLDRIKSHRGTAILPQQTGPVIDVLYSAAGNSADEAYYSNGIIGFDFEIGATNYYNDTGVRAGRLHAGPAAAVRHDTTNPCLLNEGFHEAMEFASGNYGMLEEALDYAGDTTAPVVEAESTPPPARNVSATRSASRATRRPRSTTRPTARRRPRPRPSTSRHGPGAAAGARAPGRHDAEVDRARLQGQHVRGQVAAFIPHVDAPGDVSGTVPAHAVAGGRRGRQLRRVHAGRRARTTSRRRRANVIRRPVTRC